MTGEQQETGAVLSPRKTGPSRINNLDLIRLFAALHVVLIHSIEHTGLRSDLSPFWSSCFDLFVLIPAVPIFFVISGFLIMASYERNPGDLKGYFLRRGLRIYPALWVALLVAIALLAWRGFLSPDFLLSPSFVAWLGGQITFVQFWNPEHFRGFGTGVVNGALWTIAVELQFYLIVPIWSKISRFLAERPKSRWIIDLSMVAASVVAHLVMRHGINAAGHFADAPAWVKLLHMTFLPHFYMFQLGVFLCRYYAQLKRYLNETFLGWAVLWVSLTLLGERWIGGETALGTVIYLLAQAVLALAVISMAYTRPTLSGRILHGTDISYGTYLFHFLIINSLVEMGYLSNALFIPIVFTSALLAGYLSWTLIEKPALSLKSKKAGGLSRFSTNKAEESPPSPIKHPTTK